MLKLCYQGEVVLSVAHVCTHDTTLLFLHSALSGCLVCRLRRREMLPLPSHSRASCQTFHPAGAAQPALSFLTFTHCRCVCVPGCTVYAQGGGGGGR